jgi:hypothetical protein
MARPVADGGPVCLRQHLQLALPADERRVEPSRDGLLARQRHEPVRLDGLVLPLQVERLDRLDLDRGAHEPKRRLAEQDLPGPRRALQPRRHVDRVTRREPLAGGADHDLAAVDADVPLDPERRQRGPHLQARPHRPQRVVLVHHRRAEHRHDGVADELLDDPAVALDDRPHLFRVLAQEMAKRLRVE